MSPSAVEVLLHYYRSPEEHGRIDAPAVEDAIRWFVEKDVLRRRDKKSSYGSSYETTPRGNALVEAICSTPFPVQAWVLPEVKAELMRRQAEASGWQ